MIAGIISEYNPFHNGHLYQIQKINETLSPDGIIAVMSGSFVQRGEPSCINKFDRAFAALSCGISVVIELPCVFSSSAADIFSFGACDIMNKTNIVDYLCFGCESDNTAVLKEAADILFDEDEAFVKSLRESLSKGNSYPKARYEALRNIMCKDISFLKEPNAILAVEYLKALKSLGSNIKPFLVKRNDTGYNATALNPVFSSASAIRTAFEHNICDCIPCMPEISYKLFSRLKRLPSVNDYTSVFYYIMITKKLQVISEILDVTEGLENRLYEKADGRCLTSLIDAVKTKRYPYSKIQRAILHIILDITKENAATHNNPYIRVLGFRLDKKHILSQLVKNSAVPVVINVKNAHSQLSQDAYKKLKKEFTATDIYYMTQNNERNMDFTHPLVVV